MVKSILITNSPICKDTGGGVVGYNLAKALMKSTDLKAIFSDSTSRVLYDWNVKNICVSPRLFYQNYSPFLFDYLVRERIIMDKSLEKMELAQFYADPWGMTAQYLKNHYNTKIIADLAPHNIEISEAEHIKRMGSYPYVHLTDEFLYKIYSKHLRIADRVIVHSRRSGEYIKKKAEIENPIHIIPHGCYPPESIPEYPDEVTPGYMGAFGIDKGFFYLAVAWVNYNSKNKLVLAGKESTQLKIHNAENRFEIIGYIKDLLDFYNKISIYIQPSVSEGFGITVLEAMSYGRPVIVTEETGSSELVTDGKDGFVIPIRDQQAIADKIRYFVDNPDEVKRMGGNARKTSLKYDWKEVRKLYERVYNTI